MWLLIFVLSVAMSWITTAKLAVAESAAILLKPCEGSLVIKGGEKETSIPAKRDILHSMLSREGQVYVFSGNTRISLQSYGWEKPRPFPPVQDWQRSAEPNLEILIQKYASHYRVDPSLVRAVMRNESGFSPSAVSPKGAQGLMQLMPRTASFMGVNNPFDPEQNIAGGVRYLRYCLDCFGHNVPLAVAAYNAGPGRVAKSQGVPAIPETQSFVKNVMGSYTGRPTVSSPEAKLTSIPKPTISTPSSLTPKTAASDVDAEKAAARPRPKFIVVRHPSAK